MYLFVREDESLIKILTIICPYTIIINCIYYVLKYVIGLLFFFINDVISLFRYFVLVFSNIC